MYLYLSLSLYIYISIYIYMYCVFYIPDPRRGFMTICTVTPRLPTMARCTRAHSLSLSVPLSLSLISPSSSAS